MRLFSDSIDFVGCVYSRISFYDLRFLVAFWRTFLLLFVIVFRCIEVMRHKKSIFSSFFICWIFGGAWGSVLDRPGGVLERPGAVLGPSWGRPGTVLEALSRLGSGLGAS